jgi:hypothetical protein
MKGENMITALKIPSYPAVEKGTKIKDHPKATPEEQIERIAFFRKIVAEKKHQPVYWIDRNGKRRSKQVDLFTASVVCTVYDALNDDNKAIFCSLEPIGMINLAYKLAK